MTDASLLRSSLATVEGTPVSSSFWMRGRCELTEAAHARSSSAEARAGGGSNIPRLIRLGLEPGWVRTPE